MSDELSILANENESRAACIVFEQDGWWAARLRFELQPFPMLLRQVRSLDECLVEAAAYPRGLVLLAATDKNLDCVAEFVCQTSERIPGLRSIVILAPEMPKTYFLELKELGACHVAHSVRELKSVANIVGRHVGRFNSARGAGW